MWPGPVRLNCVRALGGSISYVLLAFLLLQPLHKALPKAAEKLSNMLKGKVNLTLILALPNRNKLVVPKIWGRIFQEIFQSVFINLCFAPASALKQLALSVFCVQFVDTGVGFIHSTQMQVLKWKMQMLWMFGKWRVLCMKPSWHSGAAHRFHRLHSNAENIGMWLLLVK